MSSRRWRPARGCRSRRFPLCEDPPALCAAVKAVCIGFGLVVAPRTSGVSRMKLVNVRCWKRFLMPLLPSSLSILARRLACAASFSASAFCLASSASASATSPFLGHRCISAGTGQTWTVRPHHESLVVQFSRPQNSHSTGSGISH